MNLSPATTFLKSRITAYVALIILCFLLVKQCQKTESVEYKLSQNKERVSIATKIVERYVDTNGIAHTAVQPEALTRQQAESFIENDTYVNDTLVKALNIANSQIAELTRINASLEISSKGTVKDPGNALSPVTGSDKWLAWTYNPADTSLGMKYDLQLDIAGVNKRKKILGLGIGAPVYYEDYSTPDKRLTINGVDRFSRPVPEPAFSAKINARSRINFGNGQVSLGPEAELTYKRLTVGTAYMYDATENRWSFVLRPGFNFVKF